ncbi:MAG TPA: ZIP family metal transporter [Blastocatellia bacterium]|jgi:zinc transporter ZupT|nr:ZIP family metal transporter [Blastocatellia bacterium]
MNSLIQLISFGLLAAIGNIVGGVLITGTRAISKRQLRYLIAFGAGFMLGAVFLEVIPEVALQWNGDLTPAMGLALAGYLLIQFVEHTIAPHFHFGEETHSDEMMRRGVASAAIIGLSVHTFFDGVAIASGLLTSFRLGLLLFIAILLHKIPEGFTVASIALASGRGNQVAMRATSLIAGATFAGMLLTFALQPAVKFTLPFSAGVTLYVAASDLIPEVNREDHHEVDLRTSLLVFAGAALFYLAHLMLHGALD